VLWWCRYNEITQIRVYVYKPMGRCPRDSHGPRYLSYSPFAH
jgi:hypothetical protein